MAKKSFVIACPKCGTYVEGSTGIFASNTLKCSCGYKIDLNVEALQSKECPHCGNMVKYDVRKGDDAVCPICKEKLGAVQDIMNKIDLSCPTCNCKITVNKKATVCTCPMCNTKIDVQERIRKEEVKKQGFASLIKYEGDNTTFVWKHPIEDFNCGSQLIVHESQEALFFRDGRALDTFGAGRYTLATSNLPLLENLYKLPTNADETFHSEIYFVNLATQMGIKWGTDSKVRLLDPDSNMYIEIGACGLFNLRVCDSRKLIIKLVGTTAEFGQDDMLGKDGFGTDFIKGKFKALVMNKVKANLARIITTSKISIITIDQYIDLISERMKDVINEQLEQYGLTMPEFYITNVILPEDDPAFNKLKSQYGESTLRIRDEQIKKAEAQARQERIIVEHETEAKIKVVDSQAYVDTLKMKSEADAEAYRKMALAAADGYKAQALAEAEEMKAKGYTYSQETSRIVGKEAFQNGITGGGSNGNGNGVVGDVIGLGVTLGAVGSVVNMTKDAIKPIVEDAKNMGQTVSNSATLNGWNCPSCGKQGITSNFCPDCGAKKPIENAGWNCPNCGEKNIKSKFCPNCGVEKTV